MKDSIGAIRDFSSVLKFDSTDNLARLYRARAYGRTGENAKALADLNLVLKQAPYFAKDVLQERSKIYRAMGNVKAAAADEQRLTRLR